MEESVTNSSNRNVTNLPQQLYVFSDEQQQSWHKTEIMVLILITFC
jgi:hypothetical protein